MKAAIILFVLFITHEASEGDSVENRKPRLNFYVANKLRTLDLFSRFVIWRARLQGMKHRDEMFVIVAGSSKEASDKILDYLQKKDALIGNIWFDSHGRYYNGYSSFILGDDEFSYKTVGDTTNHTRYIRRLAGYVDNHTLVALGSCYSGATYDKPASSKNPSTRMNGDSLLIGMAALLPGATIYGAEGWVMTKPGVFHQHSYALSGFPIQKKFKDEIYLPVWENMGVWNSYNALSGNFEKVNSIALTRNGSIHIKSVSYLEKKKFRKRQAKNLRKLELVSRSDK